VQARADILVVCWRRAVPAASFDGYGRNARSGSRTRRGRCRRRADGSAAVRGAFGRGDTLLRICFQRARRRRDQRLLPVRARDRQPLPASGRRHGHDAATDVPGTQLGDRPDVPDDLPKRGDRPSRSVHPVHGRQQRTYSARLLRPAVVWIARPVMALRGGGARGNSNRKSLPGRSAEAPTGLRGGGHATDIARPDRRSPGERGIARRVQAGSATSSTGLTRRGEVRGQSGSGRRQADDGSRAGDREHAWARRSTLLTGAEERGMRAAGFVA
jgi:hypothetical protein